MLPLVTPESSSVLGPFIQLFGGFIAQHYDCTSVAVPSLVAELTKWYPSRDRAVQLDEYERFVIA